MALRWLYILAAMLLTTERAAAQPPTGVDSAWVAELLPIVRPLVGGSPIVAVGADTSDHRSLILAVALAAERGVAGPGAPVSQPGGGSDCTMSSAPADTARPRGNVVWVRWIGREGGNQGILTVSFSCRWDGRPFGQGLEQRVERAPDGRWRAVGRPGGWIS